MLRRVSFFVTETFLTPKDIKQKLRTYALESRRDIRMEKCDKERVRGI